MSTLSAIVYVSNMTHEMTIIEIEYLLMKARERNKEHDVTGLLLCHHGAFMQYIEGPQTNLLKIYDVITADPNHNGIIQLVHTQINAREFEDWSMAYTIASKTQIDTLKNESWLENDDDKSLGRTLLSNFWKTNAINHA